MPAGLKTKPEARSPSTPLPENVPPAGVPDNVSRFASEHNAVYVPALELTGVLTTIVVVAVSLQVNAFVAIKVMIFEPAFAVAGLKVLPIGPLVPAPLNTPDGVPEREIGKPFLQTGPYVPGNAIGFALTTKFVVAVSLHPCALA